MTRDSYTKGEYQEKNPTWHIEDSPWKAKQILKMIKRNRLKPLTVAEVGCGAGEILNQLYKKLQNNIKFFGFEISPQAFNMCLDRSRKRLQFFLRDLLAPEDHHFFDVLLVIDVFEHIEDYFSFLRKVKDKGEYKIFHIPLDISSLSAFAPTSFLKVRQEVGHIHHFTKETALATLEDTGYEIIDYFYTPSALELPYPKDVFWKWIIRLTNIPRGIVAKINQDLSARMFGGFSLLVLAR